MPIYTKNDPEKPADINTREMLDMKKTDLLGLFAYEVNRDKDKVVMALMELIKQGDPASLKMLEKAFNELKPQDEKNRPIPILMGITQKRNVSSNNSVEQDPRAEQKT